MRYVQTTPTAISCQLNSYVPDSRFPTPDSRFPIPDSLFPTPLKRLYLDHDTFPISLLFPGQDD
ncbi:MAG: hypothetical protein F6K65_11775 [Moorea sp. SIO3C2]|nr:hypothetical protein [Moorena sp. SIO3C2]